jgi:beta-carotene ketolase (CrtW type)
LSGTTGRGIVFAALILLGWLLSLVLLLAAPQAWLPAPLLLAALLLRTQLQTGLFIVGHDAMHGVLLPERPLWNDRLGAAVLALYAGLPYRHCRQNHQQHHQRTATAADPDFQVDPAAGVLGWYGRFMAGYLSAAQMARLLAAWAALALLAGMGGSAGWRQISARLLLACILPLLFSSLQLFLVGTYLPHRRQRLPLQRAAADNLPLPGWLSLLACYHFGYHREHHSAPRLAWFQLPARYRLSHASNGALASPQSPV